MNEHQNLAAIHGSVEIVTISESKLTETSFDRERWHPQILGETSYQ